MAKMRDSLYDGVYTLIHNKLNEVTKSATDDVCAKLVKAPNPRVSELVSDEIFGDGSKQWPLQPHFSEPITCVKTSSQNSQHACYWQFQINHESWSDKSSKGFDQELDQKFKFDPDEIGRVDIYTNREG